MSLNLVPSRKRMLWLLGGLILAALLAGAAVSRFVILPKQHDYVLQPEEVSTLMNQSNPPACDPEDLSTCPKSPPFKSGDVIAHPKFGMIVKDRLEVVFKREVAVPDAVTLITSLSANILAYSPGENRFFIRLSSGSTPDDLVVAMERFRGDSRVQRVLPSYVGSAQ